MTSMMKPSRPSTLLWPTAGKRAFDLVITPAGMGVTGRPLATTPEFPGFLGSRRGQRCYFGTLLTQAPCVAAATNYRRAMD